MSKLQYHGRPWVNFDPGNKDHRRWFAEFQDHNTWGKCPVRFIVSDDHGDLLSMVRYRLLDYYMHREFKHSK